MKRIYPVLLATIILAGCATQKSVLAPYTKLPLTCEANAAEMLALADADAMALNVNFGIAQIPAAAAYAAGAGLIPKGFTWAPVLAAASQYYRQGTHELRINFLAHMRLHMKCPALVVPEQYAPVTTEFGK